MMCNKLSQPKRGFEHCMYPKSAARRLLQQIEDLNIEKATFTKTATGQTQTEIDWIGLRENLQETIDFPIKYGAFL